MGRAALTAAGALVLLASAWAAAPAAGASDPFQAMQALRPPAPVPAPDVVFRTLDGRPVRTDFVSQQELAVTIPAHLMQPGVKRLAVTSPRPWEIPDLGGTSNAVAFIVRFKS